MKIIHRLMIFIECLMLITQVLMSVVSALMVVIRRLMIAIQGYTTIMEAWVMATQPSTKIAQHCLAVVHFSSRSNNSFALIGLAM